MGVVSPAAIRGESGGSAAGVRAGFDSRLAIHRGQGGARNGIGWDSAGGVEPVSGGRSGARREITDRGLQTRREPFVGALRDDHAAPQPEAIDRSAYRGGAGGYARP